MLLIIDYFRLMNWWRQSDSDSIQLQIIYFNNSQFRHIVAHLQRVVSFVTGLLWIECKQIYHAGVREHFIQYCNYMDFR